MRNLLVASLFLASAALLGACASEQGAGTLTGTTWKLISITTVNPQFAAVVPEDAHENYTIIFNDDGTFNARADCNQLAGTYTVQGDGILTLMPGPMTLAACPEGSLSDAYINALGQAGSYTITENQMTLTLEDNGTLSYNSGA